MKKIILSGIMAIAFWHLQILWLKTLSQKRKKK